jgi:hypothetical protein
LIGVLSLMWAHGSLAVSVRATSTATPLGVGQNFGGRLVTAANQLRISPKVATTAGDALVAIVEVRRNSGLTTVSNISDGSGDVWFRATSVHNGTDDEELWYVAGAQSIPTSGKITIKTALSRAIAATVVELQGIATGASLDVTATSSGVSASPSIGPSAATIDANEIAIGDTGVTEPDALRESDQTRRGDLQTPLTGIPMQRESISPAEQHYLAAHPVNPDDPT